MEILMDDCIIFNDHEKHTEYLHECFGKCMEFGISIDVAKSVFFIPFGRLVGHIRMYR